MQAPDFLKKSVGTRIRPPDTNPYDKSKSKHRGSRTPRKLDAGKFEVFNTKKDKQNKQETPPRVLIKVSTKENQPAAINLENEALQHPSHKSPPGGLSRTKSLTTSDLANIGRSSNSELSKNATENTNEGIIFIPRTESEEGPETEESPNTGGKKKIFCSENINKKVGRTSQNQGKVINSDVNSVQEVQKVPIVNGENSEIQMETNVESVGSENNDNGGNDDGGAGEDGAMSENGDANTEEIEPGDEADIIEKDQPSENEEGQSQGEFNVVMEFREEDSAFLDCPIEVCELMMESGKVQNQFLSDMKINKHRKLIFMTIDNLKHAEEIIRITSIGSREVKCRWAKENKTTSFGVIGPIACPREKDEMDRKKKRYIDVIKATGIDVVSMEWISKREKRENNWSTTMTKTVKLEFLGETPERVFIGAISYPVGEYFPEATQCFNCQNFGHTSVHCQAGAPVCVFCGEKGHRVKENKCRTRKPRCYHCKGEHPASYRGCIKYRMEKAAQKLKM